MAVTESLAYFTKDHPGIGGVIKAQPDDFLVEEQPLYQPCGEGEHLYLLFEKRGLTTPEALRRIARAFRISKRDIGYAGLKDKHAVTRQHVSLYLPRADPSAEAQAIERIAQSQQNLQILWADRHTNKLQRGHHAGNRFVIYIREVLATAVVRARNVLDQLIKHGVPNYIGEQRFGYRANGHVIGRLMLSGQYQAMLDEMLGHPIDKETEDIQQARLAYERGDYVAALNLWPRSMRFDRQALDALRQGKSEREAVLAMDRAQRHLFASALQSVIFNQVLHMRLLDGQLTQLVEGDLAWKHDSRSVFAVDAQTAELENHPDGRVAAFEVSPSGPMWGKQMTMPTHKPAEMELEALAEQSVSVELMQQPHEVLPSPLSGSRRSLRMAIENVDLSGGMDERGGYVRLAFELPRGSFATMLLREIMKNQAVHQA